MLSEAKYRAKYGEGLDILTPKQILQRLPIAPAQIKAGITHAIIIDLKYQLQHGLMNLNYLMDHILYQIFRTISSILQKSIMKGFIILQ